MRDRFPCPACRVLLTPPDGAEGRTWLCPRCGAEIRPQAEPGPPAPIRPAPESGITPRTTLPKALRAVEGTEGLTRRRGWPTVLLSGLAGGCFAGILSIALA